MGQIFGELPTKLYTVRVPELATYSEFELETFGFPMMEVNGEIKKSTNNMVTVELTLDKIIDIYSNGFTIRLVNHTEVTEIYSFLEDYLRGVNHTLEFSPNLLPKEDKRLNEIDKFANEIFNLNRLTIIKDSTRVNNSFDIGFAGMNLPIIENKPVILAEDDSKFGIMSGYDTEYNPSQLIDIGVTYINTNQPELDIDKIRRESAISKHYTL